MLKIGRGTYHWCRHMLDGFREGATSVQSYRGRMPSEGSWRRETAIEARSFNLFIEKWRIGIK